MDIGEEMWDRVGGMKKERLRQVITFLSERQSSIDGPPFVKICSFPQCSANLAALVVLPALAVLANQASLDAK